MEYHLSHAMILEGPDPEANLALAKKLAQQAVCTAGGRRPCGVCRDCVKAAGGSHPDIAVYGGKGGSRSFHVEEVRQIRDSAAVMPNEAQAKVYILDGADHMTEQAQNALLKVLEEPPSYVIFLLTCGAASSLLPTVRSRAQIFRVQKEDNPQTEESEAFLLAESMAKAVPSAREYDLVSKTGTLTKDKELFRAVLKELALIFSRRLRFGCGRGKPGYSVAGRRLPCPAAHPKKADGFAGSGAGSPGYAGKECKSNPSRRLDVREIKITEVRMAEVIGVRFKEVGKVYYFDPNGIQMKKGDMAIVETARGVECGEVAMENREIEDKDIVHPLKKMIRKATQGDLKKVEENRKKERHAFEICEKKILDHKLEMKLVDVEYTFDNNKILFYFTADGRVDFRELVKDLASVFRTRIELRQIGVRDEAKMMGGLGICGRPFCCTSF